MDDDAAVAALRLLLAKDASHVVKHPRGASTKRKRAVKVQDVSSVKESKSASIPSGAGSPAKSLQDVSSSCTASFAACRS
jgi:hypothetical protein